MRAQDSLQILAIVTTKHFANSAMMRDEDPITAAHLTHDLVKSAGCDMYRLANVLRELSNTSDVWMYTFYDELLITIYNRTTHDFPHHCAVH